MQITATNKPLRVDYRVKGKTYSEGSEQGHYDEGDRSTWPFDSVELAVGQSINLGEGDTLVRVTPLGDAAQPVEQPALA